MNKEPESMKKDETSALPSKAAGKPLGKIDPKKIAVAGGGAKLQLGQAAAASGGGDARWSARTYLIFGLISLFILVGGFGGWAVGTTITGAIIASGRIEVDRNQQVVQHVDGGVVQEIHVKAGDVVEAGQLLYRLDAARLAPELAIVESQYFELLARRSRLSAERDSSEEMEFPEELVRTSVDNDELRDLMDGQLRLFEARRVSVNREIEQLGRRREQIESQIDGIIAQIDAMIVEKKLLDDELIAQESLLERGLAQSNRVLALRRDAARMAGQLGELEASKAQAEGQITELELEVLRLSAERREEAITELRDIRNRELELAERRRALKDQIERLDIRAPVGGIVHGIVVQTPRAVIRPAEALLYIIPQDRPLIIAAQVEPIHVDQVYPSQRVLLRFAAFDQNTTPELYGVVDYLSADALSDEQTGFSYYRAEIVLDADEQAKLPEEAVLIPGMPVEAFIQTADRSPLDYLTKPLTDFFSKALREG